MPCQNVTTIVRASSTSPRRAEREVDQQYDQSTRVHTPSADSGSNSNVAKERRERRTRGVISGTNKLQK